MGGRQPPGSCLTRGLLPDETGRVHGRAAAEAQVVRQTGRVPMKNIQVIDGALNCVYDVFAASDDDDALLFPAGTDVAFAEDLQRRHDLPAVQCSSMACWRSGSTTRR